MQAYLHVNKDIFNISTRKCNTKSDEHEHCTMQLLTLHLEGHGGQTFEWALPHVSLEPPLASCSVRPFSVAVAACVSVKYKLYYATFRCRQGQTTKAHVRLVWMLLVSAPLKWRRLHGVQTDNNQRFVSRPPVWSARYRSVSTRKATANPNAAVSDIRSPTASIPTTTIPTVSMWRTLDVYL